MQPRWGFTLIELLVVITIVSLLTIVVTYSVREQGASTRDAQRQADLRNLQTAIELYKQRYGRYPEGCNGPVPSINGILNPDTSWSGEPGTNYACSGDEDYIIDLAPEFIRSLPTDPQRKDADSGYVYATNDEGSVYIVKARRTVESETVTETHEFKSCDTDGNFGICDAVDLPGNPNTRPSHCNPSHTNQIFATSYGVWGGFAESEEATEDVICRLP